MPSAVVLKNSEQTKPKSYPGSTVDPGSFEPEKHFYPRVLNATLHPVVKSFLGLGHDRLIKRYCHLHPLADKDALRKLIEYKPNHFFWAGADLFNVTNEFGNRQMIVIETNSCPSGQKSMPAVDDNGDLEETSGYSRLSKIFYDAVQARSSKLPEGGIAVLYDKNDMESTGYASKIADVFGEKCWLVKFYNDDPNPCVKWDDGILSIKDDQGNWVQIRAVFRYVTQTPWDRIPLQSKTFVFNSILSCLAGGRNKLVGSKAYEFLNAELSGTGLAIRTPETINDVGIAEIPLYVKSMGYCAVIKIPYSNAGQGVYTICSKEELDRFMALDHKYDKFIVQALVGNSNWSSKGKDSTYYHVGTVPNRKNNTFVCDIRMMVGATSEGFIPLSIYARKAAAPLTETLENVEDSWQMLGTNLSIKTGDNSWSSDSTRLMLMDRKDFNHLGMSIDDLVDGYVQATMAAIAIDKMATRLLSDGKFNYNLFSSINDDQVFTDEICRETNWSKTDGQVTKN